MRADYREKLVVFQHRLRAQIEAAYRRLRGMDLRTAVSLGCIALGACLLAYVSWNYASMYVEQRELAREWQRQQQAALMHPVSDKTPSPKVSWDDGLTRLTVPKIGLDAIVVEGTNYHDLKLGPGHLKDTPAPGDEGNSVISGHRDTFFRHIHELDKGDEVLVQRGGRTYRYAVTGKKIVDPDDTWVAEKTKDSELTLITCYPTYYIGPAPNRLVVFTKLVGEQPESAGVKTAAAGTP